MLVRKGWILNMVGIFKIKCFKAFLQQANSTCFHIQRHLFGKLGGLEFLLKFDFEIVKIPVKLSNLHRQILQFWKMVFCPIDQNSGILELLHQAVNQYS